MQTLPIFYIRRAWYIILEHAKNNLIKVDDDTSSTLDDDKNCINFKNGEQYKKKIKKDEIIGIEFSHSFSPEEKKFNEDFPFLYSKEFHFGKNKKQTAKEIQAFWLRKLEFNDHKVKKIYQETLQEKSKDIFNEMVDSPLRLYSKPEVSKKNRIITTSIGLTICDIAIHILNELNTDDVYSNPKGVRTDLELITSIRNLIDDIPSDKLPNARNNDQFYNFWKSNQKIPDIFINSYWACFERTDGVANNNGIWGISKSQIYIGYNDHNNYTPIILTTKYGNVEYKHKGVITYDSQSQYIFAHLQRDLEDHTRLATPTFFIFPTNNADNTEIIVGYVVYYSIYYLRYIVKVAILKKEKKHFDPINLSYDKLKESDISTYIIRFLHNRTRNRLTIPSTPISNLDKEDRYRSLQSWLVKRYKEIMYDKILHACVNEYYVCYFRGGINNINVSNHDLAENINIDSLTISFDNYEVEFNAEFIHHIEEDLINIENSKLLFEENLSEEEDGGTAEEEINNIFSTENKINPIKEEEDLVFNRNYFKGKVRRLRSTIEIQLEEEDLQINTLRATSKSKTPKGNFILLTFCVPDSNKSITQLSSDKYQYFPGIISGLSDENNNPVSYRALVIKKITENNKVVPIEIIREKLKKVDETDLFSKRIIQYFRRNLKQSQINVYPFSSNFSDKYSNIDILILDGGEILVKQKKDSSGMTIYIVNCFKKSGEQLGDIEFVGTRPDDALKEADEWLLLNYVKM